MRKTLCEASAKKFLSDRGEEHSAVCWSVSAEYYMDDDQDIAKIANVDATLRIQDCTRSINIEFEAYGDNVNQDMFISRLMKIDNLIGELEIFKDEMRKAYAQAIKHNEETT